MSYYNPYLMQTQQQAGITYPTQMSQVYQVPQQTPQIQQQPQPQQPALSPLNGKIVDSEEMVKATEVPIGGYGVFPKADLSEIFVKVWNNNGTTNVITFKPVFEQKENTDNSYLLKRLEELENKVNSLFQQPQSQPQQRKENRIDEF